MTAVIKGFDSRADLGLRRPKSVSRNIDPLGTAVHWFGPRLTISDHDECQARWRQAQNMHMAPGGLGTSDGAADIAYNLGVCVHQIVLAGRGAGIRSGANGTSAANRHYYAVAAVIGAGDPVPDDLLDALDWAVLKLQTSGGAGKQWRPHSAFRTTSCPGDRLRQHAAARDGKAIPTPAPDRDDWIDQWPSWARGLAREWARRGIITRHTKPGKQLANMSLWELHTFAKRLGARDATTDSTDLDQRIGETTYVELLAFLDRWGV